jgi:hypothetical protein
LEFSLACLAERGIDDVRRAVIIINPLTAGWVLSRARDGLHPTAVGSAWIAC